MRRVLVLVLAAICCGLAAEPASAHGAIHCPVEKNTITGPWNFETVTMAKRISCGSAVKILKVHDQEVEPGTVFSRGSHFRLGGFSCKVTRVFYESARSGCHDGRRFFKIDYGS